MWLKIEEIAGIDDFGLDARQTLIVSARALEILKSRIAHASVAAIDG